MSVSETSPTNNTALKSNDALMPDSTKNNQIAEMAEAPLLSAKELDELKIIYPGIDDYKTLNAYRELRTNLFNKMRTILIMSNRFRLL